MDGQEILSTFKTEGKKFDSGKARLDLISPIAEYYEGLVMTRGAEKYGDWNWAKGIAWSRIIGALKRHVNAMSRGEDFDPETGLPHIAHARCCTAFLLDFMVTHPELDDRRKVTNGINLSPK